MKAKLKKAFIKDIKAIWKKTRERIEDFIFHVVPEVDSITELKNIKKISGYTNYYLTANNVAVFEILPRIKVGVFSRFSAPQCWQQVSFTNQKEQKGLR